MTLKRSDLRTAASMWLQHRGYAVVADKTIGGTADGVEAIQFEIEKDANVSLMLIIQLHHFFSPQDFTPTEDEKRDFIVPENDVMYAEEPELYPKRSLLCFNSSRTYAAFVPAKHWNDCDQNGSHLLVYPNAVVTVLPVPWRLWAMDNLPEWLQRGWPNPEDGYQGKVGKRSTWEFHPNWNHQAMKQAESCRRLPTKPEEVKIWNGWRSRGFYRAWLEDPDDMLLPWFEEETDDFESRVEAAITEIKEVGETSSDALSNAKSSKAARTAAKRLDTTMLEARVLVMIREFGEAGCIEADLVPAYSKRYPEADNPRSDVSARFPALREKGFIVTPGNKRTGPSGRGQQVQYAKGFEPQESTS